MLPTVSWLIQTYRGEFVPIFSLSVCYIWDLLASNASFHMLFSVCRLLSCLHVLPTSSLFLIMKWFILYIELLYPSIWPHLNVHISHLKFNFSILGNISCSQFGVLQENAFNIDKMHMPM